MRNGLLAIVAAAGLAGMAGCMGELTASGGSPPPNADPQAGCALGCHGTDDSNAPPVGIKGDTDTTSVGVGAHRAHVAVAPTWHRQIECADCHVVPAEVGSPGHIDGDNRAEL